MTQRTRGVRLVVMGVAGCGKSAIGRRLSAATGLPLIEGDAFHPPGNIRKMQAGVPLTDEDRAGWLNTLARELRRHESGAVLACSALKRAYRDVLREAAPGLRFAHLALSQEDALRRVAAREGHFYPPRLVASQFEALEDPAGEPGVLSLDAARTADALAMEVVRWLEFNNA